MENTAETLLTILSHSSEATAVYDSPELHIAFVNQAMLDIWGRKMDIVGRTFGDVFPDFTAQGFTDLLLDVWQTGKTYRATEHPADITIDGIAETRYFDFEYKGILDEDGKTIAILHTASDVSSRMSAWHIIEEQDALISFNNELEVLTQTLSHDLKNPLSIVKMAAQFMRAKEHLEQNDKNNWCDTILNAASNMENIIEHTVQLNRARLYGFSSTPTPMEQILRSVCKESQKLHGSASCIFELDTVLPLPGEKSILYQIFLNVISNAVKFSSQAPQPRVIISSTSIDDQIVYTVKDNGIGIPSGDLPNIFTMFSRGSNATGYTGAGVGLCLVKRIINRLAGDITVESTVGSGTAVLLSFPAKKDGKPSNS